MTTDIDCPQSPRDRHGSPGTPAPCADPSRETLVVERATLRVFAHRVRALLAGVGAAADFLQRNHAGPHVETELLAVMNEQAARIGVLLDDFLVVVEGLPHATEQREVDLEAVARRVVRALAAEAQSRRAWLVLDAAAPVPPVWGDPSALHQALMGAVRSLLAVCRPGERVVITLEHAHWLDARPALTLTVSVGAEHGDLTRRARSLARSDLTIEAVRRIIESHGGDLEILPERPGLRWSLPVRPAPVRPAAALSR